MVRRALRDVGADAATATLDDYCRAVPRLEARLRCFLPAPEAAHRAQRVIAIRKAYGPKDPVDAGGAPSECAAFPRLVPMRPVDDDRASELRAEQGAGE
jgi:hypothetical protein